MRSGKRQALNWLACLSMSLTLCLALIACAPGSTRQGASSTPAASMTAAATATSATGAFVCANPPGSSATYAYVSRTGPMYLVHGCSAPIAVPAAAGRQLTPIAFSPTDMRLLAWDNLANPQEPDTQRCLAVVDASSGNVTPTKICSPGGSDPTGAQWYSLIGWASDASFYLADTGPDASVTVYFVSLPDLSQHLVTKLTWVAAVANASEPSGIALRGDALYYGGYMDTSEGGAFLHRFSLITETDTRIVRLGLAGTGGCQVSEAPCEWTGPWDISRDGSKIAYHSPGPTQSVSDTSNEANTPLYLAGSDGSGAVRLFPNQPLGNGFNQPSFSPDGQYAAATFASATPGLPGAVFFERLLDGSVRVAPSELMWDGWTAQPGVALMNNSRTGGAPDYITHLELYNVATGARTPLQPGTYDYVWS